LGKEVVAIFGSKFYLKRVVVKAMLHGGMRLLSKSADSGATQEEES
jgi:hypothetical protein